MNPNWLPKRLRKPEIGTLQSSALQSMSTSGTSNTPRRSETWSDDDSQRPKNRRSFQKSHVQPSTHNMQFGVSKQFQAAGASSVTIGDLESLQVKHEALPQPDNRKHGFGDVSFARDSFYWCNASGYNKSHSVVTLNLESEPEQYHNESHERQALDSSETIILQLKQDIIRENTEAERCIRSRQRLEADNKALYSKVISLEAEVGNLKDAEAALFKQRKELESAKEQDKHQQRAREDQWQAKFQALDIDTERYDLQARHEEEKQDLIAEHQKATSRLRETLYDDELLLENSSGHGHDVSLGESGIEERVFSPVPREVTAADVEVLHELVRKRYRFELGAYGGDAVTRPVGRGRLTQPERGCTRRHHRGGRRLELVGTHACLGPTRKHGQALSPKHSDSPGTIQGSLLRA
ncbi:hypothetical protein PG984_004970 [Apiospora sp. TS-2023a]